MDTFDSAISLIINRHLQAKAIRILVDSLNGDKLDAKVAAAEATARLRAIQKINRGENRCIENLCDLED